MIPLEITGSRDDAAMPQPGVTEGGLLSGSLHSGIDHKHAAVFDSSSLSPGTASCEAETPPHGIDFRIPVPVRCQDRDDICGADLSGGMENRGGAVCRGDFAGGMESRAGAACRGDLAGGIPGCGICLLVEQESLQNGRPSCFFRDQLLGGAAG